MRLKSWLNYLWKLPICGMAFFVGLILGGMVATWMGLPASGLPEGADQTTLMQYALLGSVVLTLTLASVSWGLSGGFVTRWLILSFLTWIAFGVNTYLEAAIFTTMSAATPFTVVMYLFASLFCGAAVAWLFPPETEGTGFLANVKAFFAGRGAGAWIWRLLAALLAFPLIYLAFGSLVVPFVVDFYRQGTSQLALPGWDEILPVLSLRSLFFLLACLPVFIVWQESNCRLFVTLGLALFMMVGGLNMLQAYWFPPLLRVAHSLEILADEVIYTGVLVVLLAKRVPQSEVGLANATIDGFRSQLEPPADELQNQAGSLYR
jgi:hypothetical protein